ncbi:MAG: phage tail fiber protein [Geminicoccaceae bacterium]
MSFSNFAARRVLNSFLGGASPASPNFGTLTGASTHLAAADDSGTPTEAGANFNEPSAVDGYARLALNLPADFTTATDADPSLIENAAALTFATATNAGWGTITHVGIFDSGTIGGGNLLYLLALDTNRTINDGETLSFSAGELELTLD